MTASSGRQSWWAAVGSILTAGLLAGCLGTSQESAGTAESTTASAQARKIRQIEQESLRLRQERDRLRAELDRGAPTGNSPSSPAAAASRGSPSAVASSRSSPSAVAGSAGLRRSFDALAARLSGREGLAFTSVGGSPATELGSWRTGAGWSTVKVPVAVAVVAKAAGKPDAGAQRLIRRAITASDNAAAEQLWSSLGPPPTAASTVQAVLRSAGDGQTRVQSQRIRPGFSAFGQTRWPLAGQARFMGASPCLKYGHDVFTLMGEVEAGQRWGLGAVGPPAQFKGGWGPGPGGGHLVRQMGIVTLVNGARIALAMASEPADGSFETGQANLTALARWAVANIKQTGAGGC